MVLSALLLMLFVIILRFVVHALHAVHHVFMHAHHLCHHLFLLRDHLVDNCGSRIHLGSPLGCVHGRHLHIEGGFHGFHISHHLFVHCHHLVVSAHHVTLAAVRLGRSRWRTLLRESAAGHEDCRDSECGHRSRRLRDYPQPA